jgi:hypothetical protein
MTDLSGWFAPVLDAPAGVAGYELHAFTSEGPVRLSGGPTLPALAMLPADRLALGPVTFGGMVVTLRPAGRRFVCVDDAGGLEVWEETGVGTRQVGMTGDDHEAAALLWRLMDPAATRPELRELMARLLLWAWIDRPVDTGRPAVDIAFADMNLMPGIEAFSSGRLRRLGRLVGVEVGDLVTSADICQAAERVGHPELDWTGMVDEDATADQLDFLNACLPTRWSLAEELRTSCRRPDLAAMVMAAPAV